MRKVMVHEPVIVAQSTTEPIMHGGYQDPFIRCNEKKELFVRFNSRRDSFETFGQENRNPIYKSVDGGKTWELMEDALYSWITAQKPLPNGDYLQMGEHSTIAGVPSLPELPEYRTMPHPHFKTAQVYLVDELLPILGERVAKEFKAYRVKAGTKEVVEETCKVNWDNMPVGVLGQSMLVRHFPTQGHNWVADKDGTLWLTTSGRYIGPDGRPLSLRSCLHLFNSKDMGHTWDYVSTVTYQEEYNHPNSIQIEGFSECSMQILDNGTIFCIMRSGSMSPYDKGDAEHPAPKMYCVRSTDRGKTWEKPIPFYDYGVLPQTVKLDCGTYLLSSGRPGVYLRSCDDPEAKEWSDIIPIIHVPEQDVYEAYQEYTCSNTGLCMYDEHTAFLVYSDFTLQAPNGERAKSIIVRKISVTE